MRHDSMSEHAVNAFALFWLCGGCAVAVLLPKLLLLVVSASVFQCQVHVATLEVRTEQGSEAQPPKSLSLKP